MSKTIAEVLKEVRKQHGEIITKGNETLPRQRFPTQSLSLDLELGGGVPVGAITLVVGEYSDGKTAMVLKMVAGFQEKYPNKEVVWIDAEGAWEEKWSNKLGVRTEDVHVVHPEYSQQAFDIAEKLIDADVGLIVIDSIAALVPKEEAEASMEDWQVGLAARINNKFIRKMHSVLNDKKKDDIPPSVILINQLRETMGSKGMVEPGGKGIGFAASVKIVTRKGDYYPSAGTTTGRFDVKVAPPKAQCIKFYVEKNKTAPPKTRGHVWFFFDTLDKKRPAGCYDTIEEVVRYCKKYGVCVKNAKMWYGIDPETGEIEKELNGATAFADYVRARPALQIWIRAQLEEAIRNAGEEQEVEPAEDGDNETEGDESSEESWSEETAGIGSNSLG